jgi:hypothetical protein
MLRKGTVTIKLLLIIANNSIIDWGNSMDKNGE